MTTNVKQHCKVKQSQNEKLLNFIHVKPNGNGTFSVNGKLVYLDMSNNWICQLDMTIEEKKYFNYYINTHII